MTAKQKVHSLTGRITDQLMGEAFNNVKQNRGAAGVDKESIQMFEQHLEANLQKLKRDVKSGHYDPQPLRRKFIPKGGGRFRPLGIPTVRDRIVQEVLRLLLEPIFEPLFHEASYGFRPGRNCHQAIEQALDLHRSYKVVLDADIKGFFDNIPHERIMEAVADEVADGNVLDLIEGFLRAGVMEDGNLKPTTVGTPQGGVISPLLANAVLNHLDWTLHEAGYHFVRYADDFVVLCRSRKQANEAQAFVEHILDALGLDLNTAKTEITTFQKGYTFLGFDISKQSRRMRDKSLKKFKDKVRDRTPRRRNLDQEVIKELNRVIRGTANYFATSFSTCRWIFQKLDSWIRMRLRCMKSNRSSVYDNNRLRVKFFDNIGLLSLEEFCLQDGKESKRYSP